VNVGAVKEYLTQLQQGIVSRLEGIDGKPFRSDSWQRRAEAVGSAA
jgi:coproporphyrinogen III oxidase